MTSQVKVFIKMLDILMKEFYSRKDSDQIDRHFLLAVLEEVKVVFKSGQKSLESLNSILHEIIQVTLDIDECDAQVFIEICDAASLFLHQIPKESNKRKTLPSVCDAFMDLIDISNGSEHPTQYRDYILKVSYTPLINIILDATDQERDVELIGIALKCFNYILTGSSMDLRRQISTENGTQIPQIFNLLCQCGDYDVQVSAVEAIFRLLPPKEHRKEILCSWLRSYGKEVIQSFLEIQRLSFDVDVRHFLLKVNKLFSTELKVHSIPCLKIEVSGLPLYKPKDEHYDEFWIDFNEGSKSIFVNCLQKEETHVSWDALTIKLNSIKSINLERFESHSQVSIELKQVAMSYFDSVTASAFKGKDVKILFDIKYELNSILRKIFDTKLSIGKLSRPTSPHPVMYNKKKENTPKRSASQSNLSYDGENIILMNNNKDQSHDTLHKHNYKNKTSHTDENKNEKDPSSKFEYIKENQKDKNTTFEPDLSCQISELAAPNLNGTNKKENVTQFVVNKDNKPTSRPPLTNNRYFTEEDKSDGDDDFVVKPSEKMPKNRKHSGERDIKTQANKRKLFNQDSNFLDVELRPNVKKRFKKSQISKKVIEQKTNFYESTPLSYNKKTFELPGEMSTIEMTNKKDIKHNLRPKKKVSYIESSEEEEEEEVDSIHNITSKSKVRKQNRTYPSKFSVFDCDKIGQESLVLRVNKIKVIKTYTNKNKAFVENDENNNSVLEPELLRDDPKMLQIQDIAESPEVFFTELKRCKDKMKEKKKDISVDLFRLPEFQLSGGEVDNNKDSEISSEKSNSLPQGSPMPHSIQNHSAKDSLVTNIVCNDTKLILDRIDSIKTAYKIKTEYLESLINLKASFVSSIDSMIIKLKYNL